MKFFFYTLTIISLLLFNTTYAQLAVERTAPYNAAKYESGNLFIMVEDVWYILKSIDGINTNTIIAQCKKEDDDWLEVFSEDIVEIMQALGSPLKTTAKLALSKNGKRITKTVTVTKEKRRAAREYHNTNGKTNNIANSGGVLNRDPNKSYKQVQKDIAKLVNIDKEKPFQFKSAKIEYTYEGGKIFEGKETVYVDDYGKTVVVITNKPGIKGIKEHKTTIWKDNKTTQFDHVTKTWQTFPMRVKNTEPPIIAISSELQRKQAGYIKNENEKIAGKDCMVYKHGKMNVTYWLWKGIDLKLINYSLGKNGYIKTATSVKENISIPADVLAVPAGYQKK